MVITNSLLNWMIFVSLTFFTGFDLVVPIFRKFE